MNFKNILNRIKTRIKNFIKITLPSTILILIVLEIIFRTVIPASYHPYFEINEESGYVIGKYNHLNGVENRKTIGAFATARSNWRINNHGWNNALDYNYEKKDSTKKRIAIIGDSYVEALNVDTDKSLTALLNSKYKDKYEFYSFGIGGSPFSQYLYFARYANHIYQPDAFIFVVTNNDMDESWASNGDYRNLILSIDDQNKIVEHQPNYFEKEEDIWPMVFKKSATVRYLFYNLQLSRIIRLLRIQDFNKEQPQAVINPEVIESSNESIDLLADYVIDQIKKTVEDKPVLFIHDANRKDIYKGNAKDTKLTEVSQIVEQKSAEIGFDFIDLYDAFDSDFKQNKKKFNYNADYHWNGYGQQIVADTISNFINSDSSWYLIFE